MALMKHKSEFSENIEGFMTVFRNKPTGILRKDNIKQPVHAFNFPMFADNAKQFIRGGITAGDIIAGFVCSFAF